MARVSSGTTSPDSVTTGRRGKVVDSLAQVALIANADRIAFSPFHRLRQIHAAERRFDDLVDSHRRHAKTGGRLTIDFELDIRHAQHDIGVDRGRIHLRDLPQALGHIASRLGQAVQIVAINANRHRRFDAALQHDHAPFDRLQRRGRRDARQRGNGVNLAPDAVNRDSFTPLGFRLEHDVGFDHHTRCRIERRFDAADLAENVFNFWDFVDQRILRLKHLDALREAGRRIKSRHVEPSAFIECNPVIGPQAWEAVFEVDISGKAVRLSAQTAGNLLQLDTESIGRPNQAPAPRTMMSSGTAMKLNLWASRNRSVGS